MRRARLLSALAAAGLVPVSSAHAGEPTMPLSDVEPGMRCTARSVVHGTAITTFDTEVLDIVHGDRGAAQPSILVRVSGPAVERTGIGPGFSGSPIACVDRAGVARIIGAIAESVGEYGNTLALATPIELILGEPVDLPPETRHAPALMRSARPIAAPLSVAGLSPRIAALVGRAARAAKRTVYAAPAHPRGGAFAPQTLQPGSSVSAGLASGDFTAGSIGTVAYTDGDRVWAFGHPLDAAGRRSLLLQDAYVFAVVGNPVGSDDLRTYKFAAPGHDLGTLSSDGIAAVAGRVGPLPPRFGLRIFATDLDSGKVRAARVTLADESALGLPTGLSALTQVGGVALAQMAYVTLGGLPLRQSGSMCVRITVRERARPLRFCNTYSGGVGAGGEEDGGGPIVADFAAGASALDAFNFGPLHVTGVTVNLKLRRSLRLAYIRRIVRAPRFVRRGRTFRVVLEIQRQNGPRSRRVVRVRVPRGMPAGARVLQITGTPPDGGVPALSMGDALTTVLDLAAEPEDETGPRTVEGLARRIAQIHREDGVFAAFPPAGQGGADSLDEDLAKPTGPEAVAQKPRRVFVDPAVRVAGEARRGITVLP